MTEQTEMGHTHDLPLPTTIFFSYSRRDDTSAGSETSVFDATESLRLKRYLALRGVFLWRDRDDLPRGVNHKEYIRSFILNKADGLVLYTTPSCLDESADDSYLWGVEVQAAYDRHEIDPGFRVIPVFRGVSPSAVGAYCLRNHIQPISKFAGQPIFHASDLPLTEEELEGIAKEVLQAAFDSHRSRNSTTSDSLTWVSLRTFPTLPKALQHRDLDLDWSIPFGNGDTYPSEEDWRHQLFPALRAVKTLLDTRNIHSIHVAAQSRLSAAIAFGITFSHTAQIALRLETYYKHLQRLDTWDTAQIVVGEDQAMQYVWVAERPSQNVSKSDVVVEIALSRGTNALLDAYLESSAGAALRNSRRLLFVPPEGTSQEAISDGAIALAMAKNIGNKLRAIVDSTPSCHLHIFLSTPVEFAVLVGRQLNAMGKITVYEHNKPENRYQLAYTITAPA